MGILTGRDMPNERSVAKRLTKSMCATRPALANGSAETNTGKTASCGSSWEANLAAMLTPAQKTSSRRTRATSSA